MDCNLPGLLHPWESPGKNPGVGCHALLQGVFPSQGSNLGLLHCRQILYHLSHYSAIRKNERMPFAATWMDLEIVLPNEVIQTEKEINIICRV